MTGYGWLAEDGTHTSKEHRQGIGTLTGGKRSARPLGGRSGVTSPVTLSVTSSDWTVGSFTALLDLETDATMGVEAAVFDGDSTGSITAASGSIIRWDLLSVTYSDSGPVQPHIVYTAGSVASTLPATPSNSMPLAKIIVPRSGTGSPSIQLIAPQGIAAGGVLTCATSGQYPDAPYVGQYIDDATLGLLRWDGAAWQKYGLGGITTWQAAAVGGSYSNTGPPQASWQIVNGKVHWRGLISLAAGGNWATNATILLVAAGNLGDATPDYKVNAVLASASPDESVRGILNTDGTLTIVTGATTGPYVDMAGVPPYDAA